MRAIIFAALTALATMSMASIASAQQDDQGASGPSRSTTQQRPTARDNANGGLTVQQENEIPYRPCMEAHGWVNDRLRCDNN